MKELLQKEKRLFLNFIHKNLPDMPKTFDEGLGIASERFFFNRDVIYKIPELNKIRTVLEAPCDGLMGIPGMNSVVFVRLGKNVTLSSPSEELLHYSKKFWKQLKLKADFKVSDPLLSGIKGKYDLVWNYCTFEHFGEPLFRRMLELSNKYVLIVTQNAYNYGYLIHRLYHKYKKCEWDHGSPEFMKLKNLKKLFNKYGVKIIDSGVFDVPPWFDTFDMHVRLNKNKELKTRESTKWVWTALKESDEKKLANNKLIKKLDLFQKLLFFPFNYIFAHHFYVLGELQK